MPKKGQKLRNKFYLMLALSMSLFLSAQGIHIYLKQHNNITHVAKRLNKKIKIAETDLVSETEKISAYLKKNNEKDLRAFLIKNYAHYFNNKGVEFLIYKNDSLKFWSDQVCAVPSVKSKSFFRTKIYQAGSGNYLVSEKHINNYTIIALQLLNYSFKYENEYLPKGFHKKFNVPNNTLLSLNQEKYNISNNKGEFLFSVNFKDTPPMPVWLMYILFTLYVASFLFFSTTIYYILLQINNHLLLNRWILAVILGFIILLVRFLFFKLNFPSALYQLDLFNPVHFASSIMLPSLGDLAINALLLLQFSSIIYKNPPAYIRLFSKNKIMLHIVAMTIISLVITMFYFFTKTVTNLVINSNISFRFENILSLSHFSYFAIFIIAVILISIYFFTELLILFFAKYKNKNLFILYSITSVTAYGFYLYYFQEFDSYYLVFLLLFLFIFYLQLLFKTENVLNLGRIVASLMLLTAVATYVLNKSEIKREKQRRIIIAENLIENHSYLAEYYYNNAVKELQKDPLCRQMLNNVEEGESYANVVQYIQNKYFTGYWSKYKIQITICSPKNLLNLQPKNINVDCNGYFDGIIMSITPTMAQELYVNKNLINETYYIGKINIPTEKSNINIYVEITYNEISKGLGYPELLVDKKKKLTDNLNNYSYAFYNKNDLIKKVGIYPYNIKETEFGKFKDTYKFHKKNGYSHLIYKTENNTHLILSIKNQNLIDLISSFSYIFILVIFIISAFQLFAHISAKKSVNLSSFKIRLQLFLVAISIVISLVLVTISLLFINNISLNKNNEIIKEKMNSVLFDIEYTYRTLDNFLEVAESGDLSSRIAPLSNTFFIDINIYSPDGYLLGASNDQIFKEGLLSLQIHPQSYQLLKDNKQSFFIVRENIGKYTYLSAYTAIRNRENNVTGYLNLPYFARQEEIKHEISRLISTFANIYMFMIIGTIALSLLLSGYFTRPLQHIGKQFREIKLGNKNEKIIWNRKDEIGQLVDEYNRMIDELANSADLLARSEREGAWRQMARQVAHEIKNPLTPIKLNVQMLLRAWNDKDPNWEERLKKFSNNLILQIDTLSSIAGEFSDFAQMPQPQIQEFDIVPLINQSVDFYKTSSTNVDIQFVSNVLNCFIKADENQMLRVFNNLIKNALQAIPYGTEGKINIMFEKRDYSFLFSIHDNGSGIPQDKQERIFSPNFTTKSTGMGLGLAMVKNIVQSIGGKIWFDSSEKGTTFFISMPM